MENKIEEWDLIITPKSSLFTIEARQLWKYRDLMFLFVKRDIVASYKQTLLGPIWFFIQPLLMTFTYLIIFSKIAGISTDGLPSILFYLSGITLWSYFSDCLTKTSSTFISNSNVFGKVYFPRLIAPLSVVISSMIKLGVQFILLAGVWIYFYLTTKTIHLTVYVVFLPLFILILAGLAMSLGVIISSLTTKYRDLVFLIGFGLQLFMYATPVVYPLAIVPDQFKKIILLNPATSIIEAFRFSITGVGFFSWLYISYSFICMLLLMGVGLIAFNKAEKSFIDTV